jgi:hypothetical protein
MSTIVTAADAAHFLSLVPRLVGCAPTESLVIVPLREGRSLGALRIDLPPERADLDATASTVVGLVCRIDGVDALIPVVYTAAPVGDELPGAGLVAALRRSADACGLTVADAFTVAGDGWGSHVEARRPRGGHPLALLDAFPSSGDQASGTELPTVSRTQVESVAAALASLEAALAVICGIPSTVGGDARIDPSALEAACALDDLPALYEEALRWDAATLDPMHAAVLGWCLSRPSLRDVAIVQWSSDRARGGWALDAQQRWEEGIEYPADLAEVLWGEGPRPDPARLSTALELARQVCTRMPVDQRAGTFATAGWLSWALGRSTHAGRYADDALDLDPHHGLAEIVTSFVQSAHLPGWAFAR